MAYSPPAFQIHTLPHATNKCACIALPAGIAASLEWKNEIDQAVHYAEQGFDLLWDLQFGLFDNLSAPLASSMQLSTFQLAIDQFQSLIWEKFASQTKGVLLYRGPLDLAATYPWDATQESNYRLWQEKYALADLPQYKSHFCLDVAIEYLQLLAAPLETTVYLVLQVAAYQTALEEALLLNPARLHGLAALMLNSKHPTLDPGASLGIGLPHLGKALSDSSLADLFKSLQAKRLPYRLIAPEMLSMQWNQLDTLIIQEEDLPISSKRMLQGFLAAGGQILSLKEALKSLT